jgi:hypothetical protein
LHAAAPEVAAKLYALTRDARADGRLSYRRFLVMA